MTGATLHIDTKDLAKIQAKIDRLVNFDFSKLESAIGGLVESQVRRRIAEDKTSPGGQPWPAWSPGHAKTRGSGHSLLQGEGDLLDSITHNVGGGLIEVGSNLVYAATHQFGDPDRNIPARTFLGLSAQDLADIERLVDDFAEDAL